MKDASAIQPTSQPEPKPDANKSTTDAPRPPDTSKPPAATGAPEKYADFKAPDGASLDKSAIDRVTPIFRELGLSQDAAQKLVDQYAALQKDSNKALQDSVDKMRADWRDAINKDSVMGGKLEQMKTDIGHMKDSIFGNDAKARAAFDEAMNLTGAGDHPDIVRAWWKISQRFTEGSHVPGANPTEVTKPGQATRPTVAAAMYPNLPSAADLNNRRIN